MDYAIELLHGALGEKKVRDVTLMKSREELSWYIDCLSGTFRYCYAVILTSTKPTDEENYIINTDDMADELKKRVEAFEN